MTSAMAEVWSHPSIPPQQLAVVERELKALWSGQRISPYLELSRCLNELPTRMNLGQFLDVGAGCGHYRDALKAMGYACEYRAVDSSAAFKREAERRFPGIVYDMGEASRLTYPQSSFDVVFSSACLMYAEEPQHDVNEAARVSRRYVIFGKIPVAEKTERVEAEAYGHPVIEWRFAESDLMDACHKAGLSLLHAEPILSSSPYKTFLFRKEELFHVPV